MDNDIELLERVDHEIGLMDRSKSAIDRSRKIRDIHKAYHAASNRDDEERFSSRNLRREAFIREEEDDEEEEELVLKPPKFVKHHDVWKIVVDSLKSQLGGKTPDYRSSLVHYKNKLKRLGLSDTPQSAASEAVVNGANVDHVLDILSEGVGYSSASIYHWHYMGPEAAPEFPWGRQYKAATSANAQFRETRGKGLVGYYEMDKNGKVRWKYYVE